MLTAKDCIRRARDAKVTSPVGWLSCWTMFWTVRKRCRQRLTTFHSPETAQFIIGNFPAQVTLVWQVQHYRLRHSHLRSLGLGRSHSMGQCRLQASCTKD